MNPNRTVRKLPRNSDWSWRSHGVYFDFPIPDDVADDLGDVDIEDTGDPDDEGWETEDEMEAEAQVDDSELTFSKHTGRAPLPPRVDPLHPLSVFIYS